MKPITIYAFLLALFFGSLYFGSQGVLLVKYSEEVSIESELKAVTESTDLSKEDYFKVRNGIIFKTAEEYNTYLKGQELIEFIHFCPMLRFPSFFLLMITSISFSLLGTTVLIIRKELNDKQHNFREALLYSVLGLVSGIVVLGLAELVPTLLIKTEGEIRPVTLVFLSFFSGLYIDRFFAWTDKRFGNIFNSNILNQNK